MAERRSVWADEAPTLETIGLGYPGEERVGVVIL